MEEIILIEKYSPAFKWWNRMAVHNRVIDLTAEDVVQRYQGFEGDFVLCFSSEEDFDNKEAFFNKCREFQQMSDCLLLSLFSDKNAPSPSGKQVNKMGYDVGIVNCEYEDIYSSIFNEILFSAYDELVAYQKWLNAHFLFEDRSLAEQYVATHDNLEAKGYGVEHGPMIIYEVWKHEKSVKDLE